MGEKGAQSRETAIEFFEFNCKLAYWVSKNYKGKFNINGKCSKLLTSRQFGILLIIDKYGINTVSEIEEKMSISKSSLSTTISKLVSLGYINKNAPSKDEDGRRIILSLTEKGKQVTEDFFNSIIDIFENFYNSLNETQKLDFRAGMNSLNKVID